MCPFKEGRPQLSAYKLKKTSPFFTDYSAQYNLYSKRSIPFISLLSSGLCLIIQ